MKYVCGQVVWNTCKNVIHSFFCCCKPMTTFPLAKCCYTSELSSDSQMKNAHGHLKIKMDTTSCRTVNIFFTVRMIVKLQKQAALFLFSMTSIFFAVYFHFLFMLPKWITSFSEASSCRHAGILAHFALFHTYEISHISELICTLLLKNAQCFFCMHAPFYVSLRILHCHCAAHKLIR